LSGSCTMALTLGSEDMILNNLRDRIHKAKPFRFVSKASRESMVSHIIIGAVLILSIAVVPIMAPFSACAKETLAQSSCGSAATLAARIQNDLQVLASTPPGEYLPGSSLLNFLVSFRLQSYNELYYSSLNIYGLATSSVIHANKLLRAGDITDACKQAQRGEALNNLRLQLESASIDIWARRVSQVQAVSKAVYDGSKTAFGTVLEVYFPPEEFGPLAMVITDAAFSPMDIAIDESMNGVSFNTAVTDTIRADVIDYLISNVKIPALKNLSISDWIKKGVKQDLRAAGIGKLISKAAQTPDVRSALFKILADQLTGLTTDKINSALDSFITSLNSATSAQQFAPGSVLVDAAASSPGPTIVQTFPTVAAANVPPSLSSISISFDDSVHAGSLSASVVDASGNAIPVTGKSISGNLLTLSLGSQLSVGSGYKVTVQAGAVLDTSNLPNDLYGWQFTTTPPPFQTGMTAVVSNTGGSGLNVRSSARFLSDGSNIVLHGVAEGTEMTIIGGPTNADGYTWWNVAVNGTKGWSAIADWLVPTLGGGLATGAPVVVANTSGFGLHLRDSPGLSGNILTTFSDGTQLAIVGGPYYVDGYSWWNVTGASRSGFCATAYWMLPSTSSLTISGVNPSSIQVLDWGGSVTYSIQVTNGAENALQGVTVVVGDGIRGGVFVAPFLTDSNGNTTYTTTVPSGAANAIYNITFVASKPGLTDSSQVSRQVQIAHGSRSLSISVVNPSNVQTIDWGGSASFDIAVVDQNGTPVSGATVSGQDDLRGTIWTAVSQTDFNGHTGYDTAAPSGKANGTYNISFVASKSGFADSPSVNRQIQVNHANISEVISTPNPPGGPPTVTRDAGYTYYTTGGASSNLGHTLQYQFDWGDGTTSGWLAPLEFSANKVWSAQGNRSVTLQARCSIHTSLVSAISSPYTVTVTGPSGSVQLLANGLSSPAALAVDATRVYWTDSGSGRVLSIPNDGSTSTPTTLVSGMVNPSGIAVDDTYVYFSEGGTNNTTIRKVPKSGGAVTTIASGLVSVFRIASNAASLYWTDPIGGTLRSMPKSGGTSTILANDPGNSPSGIAVDSTNVYWTQLIQPGNVMAVPLGGGQALTMGYAVNTPGVASDGTFVYWTQYAFTSGEVKATYIGKGGSSTSLVSGLNSPYDVAVDSASVFWVEKYSGNVKQLSIAGGTPSTLASGLAEPTAIAQDPSSVYWLENNYDSVGGGVLRKAPKQAPVPVAHVTVQTSVDGIAYFVDGYPYQNIPQAFNWIPGSTHTISGNPTQLRPGGGRYAFNRWSDGGAVTHSVSPSGDATFTAIYDTQFSLAVLPNGKGSVNAASTGYINAGQSVPISATPDAGYTFVGWTGTGIGSYTGPLNGVTVTMNDQIIESALFSQCAYALGSNSQGFLSTGGTGSISVAVLSGCSWQAASNVPWISVSSGATGSGNGTVTYSVEANGTGNPRVGTLTVAGLTFTVNQASTTTCTSSVSLANSVFSTAGGLGTALVSAPVDCSWIAASSANWLTILRGSTGTANDSVSYQVTANATGSSRSGTLTIAGQQFTITQSGPRAGGPFAFLPFHNLGMPAGNSKIALGNDASLFVATLISSGSNGLQLVKSTDRGATFNTPVLITGNMIINGSFDLTIDSSNAVHVAWQGNGFSTGSDIYYSHSTDGGASFGPPRTLRTGNLYGGYGVNGGFDPKVASDGSGNVYVAYPGVTRDSSGAFKGTSIWVSRSTDGGATFEPEFFVISPDGNGYSVLNLLARSGSFFVLLRDQTNGDTYFHRGTSTSFLYAVSRVNQVLHKEGYLSSLSLDSNAAATFYATYVDTSVNPSGDIYFTRSTDGGTTWGGYKRVNDVGANQRFSPVISSDANGGLHLVWVDLRSNQANQIFYSYSGDGGATFSANTNLNADQPGSAFNGPQFAMDQAHSILYVSAIRDNGQLVLTTNCSPTIVSSCLQDDSNPGKVVFVNATTGDYLFCSGGATIASGRGTLTVSGCSFDIDHTKGNRKVHIHGDASAANGNGAGTASIQKGNGQIVVQITDGNMSNNTCSCSK
jgi:hypothetical protein